MFIRPLSLQLQEKAKNELNEDPKRMEEDLKHIEEWLEKQPHLTARRDPQFLVSFLRCSKFSLQRTKEKLDYFYTMKTLTPEYFINKNPFHAEIQEILNKQGLFPLIKTCEQEGQPSIMFLRWGMFDPQKVSFISVVKAAFMCIDIMLNENDNCSITGLNIIHDMSGFSLGYIRHLTPALCKKVILSVQAAYPLRLKGLYFINTPTKYEIFVNTFKPFLNEKLRGRLMVFGENGNLHDYVPADVFPDEYGGKAGPMCKLNDEYRKTLEKYRDWFFEDEQYCSDESKRPGNPKTAADIFGVEGSFRKLTID